MIFFAIHQVWIGSKRRAEVYRDGEIAFGTVVSRKTVSDENKTYVVTFQFTDKSGEPIVKEQNVRAEAWTAASEGQGITVLYDPDQPLKRSYGYEIGDLEVVGAEPGPKPS